jgi:hypothetical protein
MISAELPGRWTWGKAKNENHACAQNRAGLLGNAGRLTNQTNVPSVKVFSIN